MSKKGEKITIPETDPISDSERKQLDHIYEKMGDRIKEAGMDELILLRFIRGYVNEENPAQLAFDTIDKCLAWRKEKKVDEIAATAYPRREEFIRMWPHGMHGVSKDGHVIYIDRPGQVSPKELHAKFTMDEYLDLHIQTMEWMNDAKIKLSQKLGRRTYKHVVIMDLDDFGFSHFTKKFYGPIKELIDIDQTKYPETLHKMYVVNAGFIVKAIWTIASPWIDNTTKSRIRWCKDTKELLEVIDKDQLPDFLGGNCKYTKEAPCFIGNFKGANAEGGEYDDIFQNFLEERQALLAKRAAEVDGDTATGEGVTVSSSLSGAPAPASPAAADPAAAAAAPAPAADAEKAADAPKAESPKAESPKAESPKAESPKAESPKAESPKAETETKTAEAAETDDVAETDDAAAPASAAVAAAEAQVEGKVTSAKPE